MPITRDRKDTLLLRFRDPDAHTPGTIATIQHALLRGIALTLQLKESGILGEPLPARYTHRSIRAYEARDSNTGVLRRRVEDAHALSKVAREALSIMQVDPATFAGAATLLMDRHDARCVCGCYRCLLRGEAGGRRPSYDGNLIEFEASKELGARKAKICGKPDVHLRSDIECFRAVLTIVLSDQSGSRS